MKILITGIAGFAGYTFANHLTNFYPDFKIIGIDNLSRKGSEVNIDYFKKNSIDFIRGDIRSKSDIDALPPVDWIIDCAANPSVLAGFNGHSSSRQLVEHNLLGTINLLEFCKMHQAGFILLSTSRVYSAMDLANVPVHAANDSFELENSLIKGLSSNGISEEFPTTAPVSLYGSTKLASETLILEYGEAFDFPVWINRCGVLAGAGQFGKADQGIFSYWINSFREKKSLEYIGFNGTGHQVRDALHPKDVALLVSRQIIEPDREAPKIINLGGGIQNSMSLKQLSSWCQERFGKIEVKPSDVVRPMDAPWIVMDSTTAQNAWNWHVETKIEDILNEIAQHAEENPKWLEFV